MKKPNNKIMDELNQILQEIKEQEIILLKLKEKLNDFPKYASEKISSFEEKVEFAKYLYWNVPKINSKSLSELLLNVKGVEYHKLLCTIDNNFICEKCKNFIILNSRTHKISLIQDKNRYGELICPECWTIKLNEHRIQRELEEKQYFEKRQEKINYLKSLPYKEYLQTQHWKDIRTRMMKRSNYSCSMCGNKNVILHIHHRSYKNLGNEDYSDLIVLCEDCHGKFHNKLPSNQ